MPYGWTRVATPEELRALLSDRHKFKARADELVERAGATIGHVYWDRRGAAACILTNIPAQNTEKIHADLEQAIGPTELLYNTEEIIRMDATYASESSSDSAPD
jgi:hypothetical protein